MYVLLRHSASRSGKRLFVHHIIPRPSLALNGSRVSGFRLSKTVVDRASALTLLFRRVFAVRARPARKAEFSTSEVASDRKQSACLEYDDTYAYTHPHPRTHRYMHAVAAVYVWTTSAQNYHYCGTCAGFFFFFSLNSSVSYR